MRPICDKCHIEFRCVKIGVFVMPRNGGYVYSGDKWECPSCKHTIIAGYGGPMVASQHPEAVKVALIVEAKTPAEQDLTDFVKASK